MLSSSRYKEVLGAYSFPTADAAGNELTFAPCKVIQENLGLWIACCGFRILCCGIRIPETGFQSLVFLGVAKAILQGRKMVYPGPIDPYFLAIILIPEPHFPQNFDP